MCKQRKDIIKLTKGSRERLFFVLLALIIKKEADMTQIFHSMIAAILGISEKQIGQTLSCSATEQPSRSSAATARK